MPAEFAYYDVAQTTKISHYLKPVNHVSRLQKLDAVAVLQTFDE